MCFVPLYVSASQNVSQLWRVQLFGLFKKKPSDPLEIVLEELGKMSKMIQDAAKEPQGLFMAMSGTAAVTSIVNASKSHLGLTVQPGTIFSQFFSAVEKQDFDEIERMILEMDKTLRQINKRRLKGAALLYWFQGER